MINFLDSRHMMAGNKRQREVYDILSDLRIFEDLKSYGPVVAGTIPIDIDIEDSDIDILCGFDNPVGFEQTLKRCYSQYRDFSFKRVRLRGVASAVASFFHRQYMIEIFGQSLETQEQDAFVHMVVEHRILELCNDSFREEIRRLKRGGLGTEPAFGKLLSIEHNPYTALLKFKGLQDGELVAHIPEIYLKGWHE
jgi:hypothetical protein